MLVAKEAGLHFPLVFHNRCFLLLLFSIQFCGRSSKRARERERERGKQKPCTESSLQTQCELYIALHLYLPSYQLHPPHNFKQFQITFNFHRDIFHPDGTPRYGTARDVYKKKEKIKQFHSR